MGGWGGGGSGGEVREGRGREGEEGAGGGGLQTQDGARAAHQTSQVSGWWEGGGEGGGRWPRESGSVGMEDIFKLKVGRRLQAQSGKMSSSSE